MLRDQSDSSASLGNGKCLMEMGLGMGGSMRQEINDDEYGLEAWDLKNSQRCFIMLANAEQPVDFPSLTTSRCMSEKKTGKQDRKPLLNFAKPSGLKCT